MDPATTLQPVAPGPAPALDWSRLLQTELDWVASRCADMRINFVPEETLALLRAFSPAHQLMCLEGLRNPRITDPGRRLYVRVQNYQRMYETGEVVSDSECEDGPSNGTGLQSFPTGSGTVGMQPPPADAAIGSSSPMRSAEPHAEAPPAHRPRIEESPTRPAELHMATPAYQTRCPGCGVQRDHEVVAWAAEHGTANCVYNGACTCRASWTLTSVPLRFGGGALLNVNMPWQPAERSAADEGVLPRNLPLCRYPCCTRCGAIFQQVHVARLSGNMATGQWSCWRCSFVLYGTIFFDRPWIFFSAACSQREAAVIHADDQR